MHIRQITAALDNKLAQLDQQLKKLEAQRAQHSDSELHPRLEHDIFALQQTRIKLMKSKDIAWRAHQLHQESNEQSRARQRIIGLSLCAFSMIGGIVLLYVALQ